MNRRDFVTRAAVIATAALCGAPLMRCALADDSEPLPPYSIGSLADFPKDGLYNTLEKQHQILIARENGKLYVMTSRCTHHGGMLNIAPSGDHFICPIHHAQFDEAGNVIHGPARKPLVRYGISADDKGNLTVDPSKIFDKQHWDDPAAFLKVS
ncbi:MAG TPA: Rieske (2Fe-2S) protein [Tepidisphaeraceae bacterium]|nr:Rieske (2Fe-2S) protein [Tepidisphaeraceae bacterium]